MSERKERVTVTLDRALVEAANAAVAAGRAGSLSAWVNVALAEHVAKERRLAALSDLLAEYEAEYGEITPAELAMWQRLKLASQTGESPLSHGGIVGQVWRGRGSRQALLAKALDVLDIRRLDSVLGR